MHGSYKNSIQHRQNAQKLGTKAISMKHSRFNVSSAPSFSRIAYNVIYYLSSGGKSYSASWILQWSFDVNSCIDELKRGWLRVSFVRSVFIACVGLMIVFMQKYRARDQSRQKNNGRLCYRQAGLCVAMQIIKKPWCDIDSVSFRKAYNPYRKELLKSIFRWPVMHINPTAKLKGCVQCLARQTC